MEKSKSTRKNYGTAYFATAFLAAFFFEFYWIMTDPTNYFMLLGTGFIMIVMGYLTIDSLLKTKADNEALRAEQNEMMLKAQKAIYIATKKNSKDSAKRQAQNIKAMEIMMNKMISSQQALLEEKNANGDDISSLIDQLSESNAKLAKEVQSAITVNQLVKANADLVKNVKEALSANAMSFEQTVDLGAYVNEAVGKHEQPKKIAPVAVEETPVTETFAAEILSGAEPAAKPDAPAINDAINKEAGFTPELDIPNMNIEDLLSPELDMPDINVGEVFMPDLEEPDKTVNAPVNAEISADINSDEDTDISIDIASDEDNDISVDTAADVNTDISADIAADEDTDISVDTAADVDTDISVDIASDEDNDISADIDSAYDIDLPMDIDTPEDIVVGEPMDDDTMNAIENEINMDEMERSEALEELIIPDEITAELDEAMTEGNPEEIMADITDSIKDDTEDIKDIEDVEDIENTGIADADAEDIAKTMDISSGEIPNRQLSDEEIASLFASL